MGTNSEENIKQGLSRREALALTRLASQNRTIITINHMLEHRVNYEPALEMIADEYDRDIDASHEDPRLNV